MCEGKYKRCEGRAKDEDVVPAGIPCKVVMAGESEIELAGG